MSNPESPSSPEPQADPVVMKRETLTIEGDRKLYRYTFQIGAQPESAPLAQPEQAHQQAQQ